LLPCPPITLLGGKKIKGFVGPLRRGRRRRRRGWKERCPNPSQHD